MNDLFTEEEKCKNWDELSKMFFNRNFGQASKSQIELLMFHFYYNKLYNNSKNDDDTTNWVSCSDYIMSKQLGITQQRISNLKVKERLAYPLDNYDWKRDFEKIAIKARWEPKTNNVWLTILDPNLYNEIQNCVEENGGVIEVTLNKKLLKVNLYDYMELLCYIKAEDRHKIIKAYKRAFKDKLKDMDVFNENGFGAKLKKAGIESVGNILSSLTGGILEPFFSCLIEKAMNN